jgi:hypothetical protein
MVVFSKKTKELFYYKLVATGCQWERGHGREDMGGRILDPSFNFVQCNYLLLKKVIIRKN